MFNPLKCVSEELRDKQQVYFNLCRIISCNCLKEVRRKEEMRVNEELQADSRLTCFSAHEQQH